MMLPASTSRVSRNSPKSKQSPLSRLYTSPSILPGSAAQSIQTNYASMIIQPKPPIQKLGQALDISTLDSAYFSKHDVASQFLDSLESLTKQDFEHATTSDDQRSFVRPSDTNNNNVYVAPPLPKRSSKKGLKGVDGMSFFATASPLPRNPRPSTVPSSIVRKSPESPRPSTVNAVSSLNDPTPKALTKTKIFMAAKDKPVKIEKTQALTRALPADADSEISNGANSDSERPDSAGSSKRVTFAADVVNYERENKPSKKRKMTRKRRQGFAHPSRGIIVPPEWEIVECNGPTEKCKNNSYLNFTQVWAHPATRSVGENNIGLVIRKERFHRVMTDLEIAHHQYNRLTTQDQDFYLIHCIFKRYILALDLALTDAYLPSIEHLLETIVNSSKVLQRSMHTSFFGPNANQKEIESTQLEHPDLALISYALGAINGDSVKSTCEGLCIETVLVKLCLEMVALVFSPLTTRLFRLAIAALPQSALQAVHILTGMRSRKEVCYIKWINNSAIQRDFRSILKNFQLLDRYGSKAEISEVELPSVRNIQSARAFKKRGPPAPAGRRPKTNS